VTRIKPVPVSVVSANQQLHDLDRQGRVQRAGRLVCDEEDAGFPRGRAPP